jgi:hypothetical protein
MISGRVNASKPRRDMLAPRPASLTPVQASEGSTWSQRFMKTVPVATISFTMISLG